MRSLIIFTKNLLKRGFDIMSEIWSGVNVKSMSVIYAYLILDGTCTFKEVVNSQDKQTNDYVTREEFNQLKEELLNAKQSIQSTISKSNKSDKSSNTQ